MLRGIFNSVLTYIFLLCEKAKGGKQLIPLPKTSEDTLIVKAKAFFGYTVEIKVERVVYDCVYENKFFSKKQFITFDVSSTVADDAPVQIKEAFKDVYTFPRMLPKFVPVEYHMERAVNSYIDMVIRSSIKDV